MALVPAPPSVTSVVGACRFAARSILPGVGAIFSFMLVNLFDSPALIGVTDAGPADDINSAHEAGAAC